MQHHFDIDVAKTVGVFPAVLINHLEFWIAKNRANQVNFHEGSYWTYNSTAALKELFPYATERQIRTALTKLVEEGYIKKGNFNKSAYDRTLWYAFTEKGESLLQPRNDQVTNSSNGNDATDVPIPDNIPDNETDYKSYDKSFKKPTVEELEKYIKEKGYHIDAEYFWHYYESLDWKRGKTKMKSWKSTLVTWERNRKDKNEPKREISSSRSEWDEGFN